MKISNLSLLFIIINIVLSSSTNIKQSKVKAKVLNAADSKLLCDIKIDGNHRLGNGIKFTVKKNYVKKYLHKIFMRKVIDIENISSYTDNNNVNNSDIITKDYSSFLFIKKYNRDVSIELVLMIDKKGNGQAFIDKLAKYIASKKIEKV
jgi:hypothetical protein